MAQTPKCVRNGQLIHMMSTLPNPPWNWTMTGMLRLTANSRSHLKASAYARTSWATSWATLSWSGARDVAYDFLQDLNEKR